MAITKTDFMRGMKCRKMLWLDKNAASLIGLLEAIRIPNEKLNNHSELDRVLVRIQEPMASAEAEA